MLFSASVKDRVVRTRPVFVVRVDGAGLETFRDWAKRLPDRDILLSVNGETFQCTNRSEVDTLIHGFVAGYRLACQKMAEASEVVVPQWLTHEGVDTEDVEPEDDDLTPDIAFRLEEDR